MNERCIANECLGTTGFSYTLSLINGKYKMTIFVIVSDMLFIPPCVNMEGYLN